MTVAGVAELADAHDSKSCGAIRAGSSPATGMMKEPVFEGYLIYGFFFYAHSFGHDDCCLSLCFLQSFSDVRKRPDVPLVRTG